MSVPQPEVEIRDETVFFGRGRYVLERVVITSDGDKVQVRISRTQDIAHSYAKASVLSPGLKWEPLCDAHTSTWHSDTPDAPMHAAAVVDALGGVADSLIARATRILA